MLRVRKPRAAGIAGAVGERGERQTRRQSQRAVTRRLCVPIDNQRVLQICLDDANVIRPARRARVLSGVKRERRGASNRPVGGSDCRFPWRERAERRDAASAAGQASVALASRRMNLALATSWPPCSFGLRGCDGASCARGRGFRPMAPARAGAHQRCASAFGGFHVVAVTPRRKGSTASDRDQWRIMLTMWRMEARATEMRANVGTAVTLVAIITVSKCPRLLANS